MLTQRPRRDRCLWRTKRLSDKSCCYERISGILLSCSRKWYSQFSFSALGIIIQDFETGDIKKNVINREKMIFQSDLGESDFGGLSSRSFAILSFSTLLISPFVANIFSNSQASLSRFFSLYFRTINCNDSSAI